MWPMPRGRVIPFPRTPAPEAQPAAVETAAPPPFAEVRRCRDQAEALVVRSLLESEGIRVVLRSNLALSVHPFSVGDQAEVTVLVPERDASRARTILIR